ncbi:MAG TPA: hypothetical protein VFH31_20375, partial [Pyrinomonadaceae bacterium]|nr:hypothetical protein [Pyrinomonadaceae bacterium]
KARLRYRSLLLTTNFKVALQVESTISHLSFGGLNFVPFSVICVICGWCLLDSLRQNDPRNNT